MAGSSVREARIEDLPALTDIYNHYIRTSTATFDLEPYTAESRAPWFAAFAAQGRYRCVVALEGGEVRGYACSHRFRPKAAYDPSVETSVYLAPGCAGRGLGSRLYEALFRALAGEDVHRAYAGIVIPNEASTALHRRFGFRPAGVFREVGRKFGQWCDVEWWERECPGA